jgi:hypothetical protein
MTIISLTTPTFQSALLFSSVHKTHGQSLSMEHGNTV